MALITCPKCGKQISDKATSCPKCGYEMKSFSGERVHGSINIVQQKSDPKNIREKKKVNYPMVFMATVLVVVILVCLYLFNDVRNLRNQLSANQTDNSPIEKVTEQETAVPNTKDEVSDDNASKENVDSSENTTSVSEDTKGETTDTSSSDEALLDSDDVKVEFKGIEDDDSGFLIVNLYVENNRDSNIYISANDSQINGYSVFISDSGSIAAGGKYLAKPNYGFLIDLENLKDYNIETIESIKFSLCVADYDSGDTIVEKPVTLTVNKTVTD